MSSVNDIILQPFCQDSTFYIGRNGENNYLSIALKNFRLFNKFLDTDLVRATSLQTISTLSDNLLLSLPFNDDTSIDPTKSLEALHNDPLSIWYVEYTEIEPFRADCYLGRTYDLANRECSTGTVGADLMGSDYIEITNDKVFN